ncbi:hypothetical protein K439DRAFT_456878 [Ramaria rubella]|nr:hypothetical protein K439DRAFT_456878 [Ramaria rubella]
MRVFSCRWSDCLALPFESKRQAQNHVYKHLGTKLAECTCGKTFASHGTAKRHVDSQWNKYACAFCPKIFTRKHSRDVHQRRTHSKHIIFSFRLHSVTRVPLTRYPRHCRGIRNILLRIYPRQTNDDEHVPV